MSETPLLGMNIRPDGSASLFEQIYEGLRDRVVSGQLAAGCRLPPSRKLADELGVSRTTVVTAYDQLMAEGFAQGRPGAGVYVSEIGEIELAAAGRPPADSDSSPAIRTAPLRPFQPGQLDARLFPHGQWARCVGRVARTDPTALVMSNDPFGDRHLRSEICRYLLEWRGLRASPGQIMMTAGSGDALEICVRTLAAKGDFLAMENPGYPPLHALVDSLGLQATWLEMDSQGFIPPSRIGDGPQPKLAVLTPSSQFPLGGAMPQARRNAFVSWAARTDGWIVEDDYDSEFRYAGRPLPALASLDTSGRTLYVGSFSKIFSIGLRLGFIVLPNELILDFSATLRRYGSKASVAPQRALALFLANGDFYRHIRRVRRIYAERRAAFLTLVKANLGPLATFDDHRAGMHIVVNLPEAYDDKKIARLAADNGITSPALSTYCASPPLKNGLLLGFCSFTIEEMEGAMGTLRTIIDASVP